MSTRPPEAYHQPTTEPDAIESLREERHQTEVLFRLVESARTTDGAIQALEEYFTTHPDSHAALSALSAQYERDGDYPSAEDALVRAIQLAQDNPILSIFYQQHLGQVLHRQGEYTEAATVFQRLIDSGEHEAIGLRSLSFLYLGDVLRDSGAEEAACSAWEQAIQWAETPALREVAQARVQSVRRYAELLDL